MHACTQLRLAKRISALLTSPKVNAAIQGRWMQYLMRIDPQLAKQVSQVSAAPLLFTLPNAYLACFMHL
jgi:hypothetical protein